MQSPELLVAIHVTWTSLLLLLSACAVCGCCVYYKRRREPPLEEEDEEEVKSEEGTTSDKSAGSSFSKSGSFSTGRADAIVPTVQKQQVPEIQGIEVVIIESDQQSDDTPPDSTRATVMAPERRGLPDSHQSLESSKDTDLTFSGAHTSKRTSVGDRTSTAAASEPAELAARASTGETATAPTRKKTLEEQLTHEPNAVVALDGSNAVVALEKLRGSFNRDDIVTGLRNSFNRSGNQKLEPKASSVRGPDRRASHFNDFDEERRRASSSRPVISSPASERKCSKNRMPPEASCSGANPSAASLDAKARSKSKHKASPMLRPPRMSISSTRRQRPCLADIMDGGAAVAHRDSHAETATGKLGKQAKAAEVSPPKGPKGKGHRRVSSLGERVSNWLKVRRNHRNDDMSSQQIPSLIEQWWTEPPSAGQILNDLRRSMGRARV